MGSSASACGSRGGGVDPIDIVGVIRPFRMLDCVGVAEVVWKDHVGATFPGD